MDSRERLCETKLGRMCNGVSDPKCVATLSAMLSDQTDLSRVINEVITTLEERGIHEWYVCPWPLRARQGVKELCHVCGGA